MSVPSELPSTSTGASLLPIASQCVTKLPVRTNAIAPPVRDGRPPMCAARRCRVLTPLIAPATLRTTLETSPPKPKALARGLRQEPRRNHGRAYHATLPRRSRRQPVAPEETSRCARQAQTERHHPGSTRCRRG